MILVIGEVLIDRFPDYERIGGAPFNFCYHLNRMGFDVRFAGRLGDDEDGRIIREFMADKGVSDDLIQTDRLHPTGVVDIQLDANGNASFDIVRDAAYDFLEPSNELLEAANQAELIYFGTLMQRTEQGCEIMQGILKERGEHTVCLYDINLRPKCYTEKAITRSLAHGDILKFNDGEGNVLKEMFGFESDENHFVRGLMKKFDLRMVSLTRGGEGSTLFTENARFDAVPSDIQIKDTVGAGDAYASVVAAGYLRGLGGDEIVKAASEFSGKICGIPGALPDDADFYKGILSVLKRG